jgi:putative NADH-flavin reductase
MKISIVGASGRTGRLILERALNNDYLIRALVRNPSKLNIKHKNLELIIGDATGYENIDKLVNGSQAVISVIGHDRKSQPDILTVVSRHIIKAMKKYDINRLISLTGTGVYCEGDRPKIIDQISRYLLKLISNNRFLNGENHVKEIIQSKIKWTIVRVPLLTNGQLTGKFRVGMTGINNGIKISRADASMFILMQLSDEQYVHQMPVISY